MATPFVQGQLQNRDLSVAVTTECAHCRQPLGIEVDSDLRSRVTPDDARPLISIPFVDFATLPDPSIIDAF